MVAIWHTYIFRIQRPCRKKHETSTEGNAVMASKTNFNSETSTRSVELLHK